MTRAKATRSPWNQESDDPAHPRFFGSAVLAASAGFVALWPFTGVIEPGPWTLLVVFLIVCIAGVGVAIRSLLRHRPAWLRVVFSTLGQLVAAACIVSTHVAPRTTLFGVVPTARTWDEAAALAPIALDQVVTGSAPLDDTLALRMFIAAGFALVAVLLDQLIAQRLTLAAMLCVVAVGVTPVVAAPDGADIFWFLLFGLLLLVALRRRARTDLTSPHRASGYALASVGALAIATTLIVSPVLPLPATGIAIRPGISVDGSLRMGEDLRRPNPVEVMTLATTAQQAPYLRLVTLSNFDGTIWHPDSSITGPLSDGFGAADWNAEVESREQTTSIRILRLSSAWLPVPFPAKRVSGASPHWSAMPQNRTVVSSTQNAAGSDYTVTSELLDVTLEQVRSSSAAVSENVDFARDAPALLKTLVADVTQDDTNDYDRLIALQSWFRTEFQYSLETPVDEGFDGTGVDAIAQFLEVREGYCIHFAGAFALMAQGLDMQSRIVVGYLPGNRTDQRRGAEYVYSVSSDQLHAWPEVFFEGIGWVPFEPTASLGVPTAFRPAAAEGAPGAGGGPSAPTTGPSTAPTTGPEIDRGDAGGNPNGSDPLRRFDPTALMFAVLGVMALLFAPAVVRRIRRMIRLRQAAAGNALAAWDELRDTLIDLTIPVSDADSPRGRAATLVRDRGASPAAISMLTDAVEQASFAKTSAAATDLSGALREVLTQVQRSTDSRIRAEAVLIPRSILAGRRELLTPHR